MPLKQNFYIWECFFLINDQISVPNDFIGIFNIFGSVEKVETH
jgi:hypothetical protein